MEKLRFLHLFTTLSIMGMSRKFAYSVDLLYNSSFPHFNRCSHAVLNALLATGAYKLGENKAGRYQTKDTPLHLLFHPDKCVTDRWSDGFTDSEIMPSYEMAWFLISKFSNELRKRFIVKKQNADASQQACKLVFKLKGAHGYTVYKKAKNLGVKSKELSKIMRDFDNTNFPDWPRLNYENNDD
jgi:hypothetical protein